MIHQFIFAHPKPGMSEQEFQRYWLEVHAPNFAGKIPQIRKYAIDTRIPLGPEPADPLWSGIAEIWLENDEEQIASLQTPEFLQGARLDEPNWAAFWRTVVLDTEANVVLPGPGPDHSHPYKLVLLVKRTNGTTVEEFRARSLEQHSKVALQLPGLVRYSQQFTRDGWYTLGETLLDGIYLFNFETEEALTAAYESAEFAALLADLKEFVEPRYIHQVAAVEHWIIGTE
jgi:uncharacterized protein (TIGR02118 family)